METQEEKIHEIEGEFAMRADKKRTDMVVELMSNVNNIYRTFLKRIINKEITPELALESLDAMDKQLSGIKESNE